MNVIRFLAISISIAVIAWTFFAQVVPALQMLYEDYQFTKCTIANHVGWERSDGNCVGASEQFTQPATQPQGRSK